MSIETPSLLHGLSIAEKVSKLSAFIGADLDSRSTHGMHAAGGCYLLIARSPDSPVAEALRSHAARLAAMGIRVRAIFSEVDYAKPVHLMAPFSVPSECRLARDPRLLAAHEQLVLTPTCSWVGDCMRRDPGKRDALERFAANCAPDRRLCHPLVREPVAGHRAGLCDAVDHRRPVADAGNRWPARRFPTASAASNGSTRFHKSDCREAGASAPASFAFARTDARGRNRRKLAITIIIAAAWTLDPDRLHRDISIADNAFGSFRLRPSGWPPCRFSRAFSLHSFSSSRWRPPWRSSTTSEAVHPFAHQGVKEDAQRYEAYLKSNWKRSDRRAADLRRDGERMLRVDPRAASRNFAGAVVADEQRRRRLDRTGPRAARHPRRPEQGQRALRSAGERLRRRLHRLRAHRGRSAEGARARRAWRRVAAALLLAPGHRRAEDQPRPRRQRRRARELRQACAPSMASA